MGFGLLLIPYMLGGMGAGDVKLMGAIGALMGTSFVLNAFVYIALIGGLISLFIISRHMGIVNFLKALIFSLIINKKDLGSILIDNKKKSKLSFPYGVAIVLGTFFQLLWGGFL